MLGAVLAGGRRAVTADSGSPLVASQFQNDPPSANERCEVGSSVSPDKVASEFDARHSIRPSRVP